MKRILFLFFLFSILLFSFCNEKKEESIPVDTSADVISSDEMAKVLEDVYLAEGAVSKKEVTSDHPGNFARHYYDFVMKKHNLTKEQFLNSYVYYSSRPDEMVKILDAVINSLSEKQGMLQTSGLEKDTVRAEK